MTSRLRLARAPLAAALLCLPAAQPAAAQPAANQHGAAPASSRTLPTAVALSPDGSTVAWVARTVEGAQLHLTDRANPDPAKERIVTPGSATACSNTDPVWAPDSQTLAFTSTCTSKEDKPGQPQIFLWSRANGETRQLTHITGLFKQAAFSPDGKTLAFLFVENASRSAGALDAMKPWAGVIGEDNLEIQGVYAIDIASGHSTWLVPATPKTYAFEFTWSPDSHHIAYIAAPAPGENNWWTARLYSTAGTSSESPILILDPTKVSGPLHGLQIAVPRYSPDGKQIAFIGGLMSDQGSTGGDLWLIDNKPNAAPVNVTPNIDGTPTFELWLDDHTLGFVEDRRGHTLLVPWDIATKAPAKQSDGSPGATDLGESLLSGGPIKGALTYSPKADTAAFVRSGIGLQPEVWLETTGKLHQFTHLNDNAPRTTAHIESIEWQNEGFHVQGWLTYPTHYDPKRKYPLIVTVHGGPTSSAFPRAAQWADLGYFEFQPNPRGSMGQGEKFVQANIKDFGYGDLRDILKGIDTIEAKVSIDKSREGLTGWSYGGFMSMFAATQTHRFAAIVAGAGISDWKSYYGENSIDQWMIPFFGASVYNDPAVYAKSSAIEFIKKAITPMLIIVGDRDGECPAPQSFEMWHALKTLGVKTQLVIYPNEGHGFRDPAHIRDRNERTVRWFAENMPEKQS